MDTGRAGKPRQNESLERRSVNIEAFPKEVVKLLGADWKAYEDEAFREERAMADKSEFVDMISEATPQSRHRVVQITLDPEVKEASRLSHWPPDRWGQWRLEMLTPWKLRPWKTKDWD